MWGYEHGGGLMGIGMLLWLAPVVLLVWFIAQFASGRNDKGKPPRSPREILDERYARGEIDRDEYHSRCADLDGESKS